jgi:Fe-S cluster assembly ATP-binding protein
MLEIKNLHVQVEGGVEIIKGLNLTVPAGEVHAIMGPNGSGKSTLSYVLSGHPGYEVTAGAITYQGQDLLAMSTDERARAGLFLAFQYPVEIPGVQNGYFLRSIVNAQRVHRGLNELTPVQFMTAVREALKLVRLDPNMLKRSVNEGFSGGEKKRNEVLQMALLKPTLCVLDETDSGLDIDALKIVGQGVEALRDSGRSFVVITHYQRLLDHVIPDQVHVLQDGKIVRSGDKELAIALEERGYEWITESGEDVAAEERTP